MINDNLRQVDWISKAIGTTYKTMVDLPLVEMGSKDFQQLKGYTNDKKAISRLREKIFE